MLTFYKQISDQEIFGYYVVFSDDRSVDNRRQILISLIEPTDNQIATENYVEFGPYLSTVSPWSSNAISILRKCGLVNVKRIEKTHLIRKDIFVPTMVDSMTQMIYDGPVNFDINVQEKNNTVFDIDDIEQENKKMKLGFDSMDLNYYKNLFDNLGRQPNNVELYDLAQSNSEHSRHWFFKGQLIKDGKPLKQSLFDMVRYTQQTSSDRSVIAFSDNASSIEGFEVDTLIPNLGTGRYELGKNNYDITFTAETHNFPTGVAPFQGATTGTGGRIRDGQAIGRGGLIIAGTAGYCVGELDPTKSKYSQKNIKTLIEASNGASDYGNKFGEPVVQGFCRTFGQNVNYDHEDGVDKEISTERVEWVKPIMFTGGIGQMDHQHSSKFEPVKEMLIVKLGGPAYRIGIGGGAASSRDQNTKNIQDDLNAVQRGDPEMENRLNRVIRTCVELGDNNPILSIHDQGAGGTANVTKEIVYPQGADIFLDLVELGDPTLTPLEIWVSEYQEQNTVLIDPVNLDVLEKIAIRENVPMVSIGRITGSGEINVIYKDQLIESLPLEPILGKSIPQKTYVLEELIRKPIKFELGDYTFEQLVVRVFRLPSVGSKRFLTNKVDRSVTGLIAQQQCVGPLHTPLSNFAIVAQSHFNLTGGVTAVGEQPIKGIIDPRCMARMAFGEMLTNMIFAKITDIEDIRCSGNWMWPLKQPGEKYALYEACDAMCKMASELEIAFDGGKDSLSMVYVDSENKETIKCPGSLVISGYAPTEDIRLKVTPDFKQVGSSIIFIDLANKHMRLGASALYQSFDTVGNNCPNVNSVELLKYSFMLVQSLIDTEIILAGHDRSDGGLITTLCEMAFAGNMGITIQVDLKQVDLKQVDLNSFFFNEELGLVIEVDDKQVDHILDIFDGYSYLIGKTVPENRIYIRNSNEIILDRPMTELRLVWENTSLNLEKLQCDPECVAEEKEYLGKFDHDVQLVETMDISASININKINVAIIRDEGSNGDREMASALTMAGFQVHDICVNDFILNNKLTLDKFRGIVFVGGFTYSDVFGAAKGWYEVIKSNERIANEFNKFYNREDTFSLGICNGCQLMSHLGWIPKCKLLKNKSGRFESRFPTVTINKTNSIMLKDMESSILGVWIAHGEGRFVFEEEPNIAVSYLSYLSDTHPLHYPENPNGSERGAAAVCSSNGRHLAMMPHPERCFLGWQYPGSNKDNKDCKFTKWFKMFINAYEWCKN